MIAGDLDEAARTACAEVGVIYRDVPVDGCWHAADIEGDPRGRGDGRIKLFRDGGGGIVVNWKEGTQRPFSVGNGQNLSEPERLEWDRKREQAIREAQAEMQRRHAEARAQAAAIWRAAQPTAADHPYLARKGVKPVVSLRELPADQLTALLGYEPKSKGEPLSGRVLIAPIKVNDELASVELIAEDGRKSALAGGAKRDGYWATHALPEGSGAGLTLVVGEGVATCLSAYEASGHVAVAALSSTNLEAVAKYLRASFPGAKLIILADLTKGAGEPDPHAIAAARAVDGKLAVPEFGSPRSQGQTDFNDLHRALGLDAVRVCIEQAQRVESERVETAKTLSPIAPWPVLSEAALVGVVGDIVRLATKDNEADPAAVLLTALALAATTIGPNVYTTVGDTRHALRLYVVLEGASSRARKGTSYDPVARIFRAVHARLSADGNAPDPLRLALEVSYGPLSTGEGIVCAVRDASEKHDQDGNPVDPGVADKRLFIIEGEFGAALKAAQREGNTLSATLRSLWDHGNGGPLVKHNRTKATGAHVGFVGHITHQELETLLQTSEIWNGFVNRILWGAVRRTKHVPFPKPIPDGDLADIAASLAECLRCACGNPDQPRTFDRAAADRWIAIYEKLTEDRPSVLGVVTSRAEAQTLRLALLYSLLDPQASMIEVQHLRAAVAVWDFCDDSARYIFGQVEGNPDPDANRIMEAIQERGEMTSTEINKLFHGHMGSRRIREILQRLQAYGKLTAHTEGGGRQGKAKTIWKQVR